MYGETKRKHIYPQVEGERINCKACMVKELKHNQLSATSVNKLLKTIHAVKFY